VLIENVPDSRWFRCEYSAILYFNGICGVLFISYEIPDGSGVLAICFIYEFADVFFLFPPYQVSSVVSLLFIFTPAAISFKRRSIFDVVSYFFVQPGWVRF
jgi:hypothetical protein